MHFLRHPIIRKVLRRSVTVFGSMLKACSKASVPVIMSRGRTIYHATTLAST